MSITDVCINFNQSSYQQVKEQCGNLLINYNTAADIQNIYNRSKEDIIFAYQEIFSNEMCPNKLIEFDTLLASDALVTIVHDYIFNMTDIDDVVSSIMERIQKSNEAMVSRGDVFGYDVWKGKKTRCLHQYTPDWNFMCLSSIKDKRSLKVMIQRLADQILPTVMDSQKKYLVGKSIPCAAEQQGVDLTLERFNAQISPLFLDARKAVEKRLYSWRDNFFYFLQENVRSLEKNITKARNNFCLKRKKQAKAAGDIFASYSNCKSYGVFKLKSTGFSIKYVHPNQQTREFYESNPSLQLAFEKVSSREEAERIGLFQYLLGVPSGKEGAFKKFVDDLSIEKSMAETVALSIVVESPPSKLAAPIEKNQEYKVACLCPRVAPCVCKSTPTPNAADLG